MILRVSGKEVAKEEFAMEYDRQGGVKDDAKGSEVCLDERWSLWL